MISVVNNTFGYSKQGFFVVIIYRSKHIKVHVHQRTETIIKQYSENNLYPLEMG